MTKYRIYFSKCDIANKLQCNHCSDTVTYKSSHQHSSTLRNHIIGKHPELNEEKNKEKQENKIETYFGPQSTNDLPALPVKDRQAIAACCCSHVLPFSVVEDKYFQWAYPCSVKQGDTIATRISELATEWRKKIQLKLKGKLLSIALDGWTDSISGNHHICILLWTGEDLFYWESKVMTSKNSESIYNELSAVSNDIISCGGKIVAAVADNARNMQSALKMLNNEHNQIIPVPCCAHLLSLMMSDALKKTSIGQLAMSMIDKFVHTGDLQRYSATRWTSRFDAMKKALEKSLGQVEDQAPLQQMVSILAEVAHAIDQIQKDTSNIIDVIDRLYLIKKSWSSNPTLGDETRSILLDIYHDLII